MFVGVDIGGTFTDLVSSVDGRLRIHKLLSTRQDPAQAMLAGLAALSPQGLSAIARVSHGSTMATNAILERKGARTALIATQGFRDVLVIGRQNRPVLYALQPKVPTPLIPRQWCYEVPERLDHTGAVLRPLDLSALDVVLDDIAEQGVESVAVCFLYSYLNPIHERTVRARILKRGLLQDWQIALSCEVLPEFREYERASTVALDAYVRPVMGRYLEHLETSLPGASLLRIMKSDGGLISARRARQQAVHTVLSGPAAGVIGAFHVAKLAGFKNVITLDMGGTSTDVSLCPGKPLRRAESEIDGLPLRVRLLDIETIGAGGGSIAKLDAGGALRVGPESAGADPGPIAYGRGGQQVTVSDANAVLGRLDPDHFLGGTMPLYVEPARAALASLGEAMGLGGERAALGVINVANVNVDRALRRVTIARGYDPRDFTLVAFGGAGPMHACEVATGLEIPRILIPRHPGVLCALGLLVADVVLDYSRAELQPVTAETAAGLRVQLDEMRAQACADLLREGVTEEAMVFQGSLDMRYQGQSYELTIPFAEDILAGFHTAHTQSYGHAMPERTVEVVNLRLQATGMAEQPAFAPEPITENDGADALLGQKTAFVNNGWCQVAFYDRARLRPGAAFAGPALAFQLDSTVFIAPSWLARVDAYRNIVLERLR
jgi:N-methylhydantoinase A